MKHLHIDCFSGVSGDMTLGALLDLGVPTEIVTTALDSLGLPAKLRVEKVVKNGFASTKIHVDEEHTTQSPETSTTHKHAHRHLRHIVEILDRGQLTPKARDLAGRMFEALAQAEADCHGTTIQKVHFHEVGAIDSIFDFAGIAVAMDWLAPERVTSTPVPTGTGFVDCQHGRMPVPAPAVAKLLTGIPLAATDIAFELTTPTGAAFLKATVDEFVTQPAMTIEKVGMGAGTRDLPGQPNVLRLLLGSSSPALAGAEQTGDSVWQVETNLDDQSGEIIGFCMDQLFEAGALDAWTVPIQMKKSRPGSLLCVLCKREKLQEIQRILFSQTGTFGVRRFPVERTIRQRESVELQTSWGPVRVKIGKFGGDAVKTPEYEDCARLARDSGVPLRVIYQEVARLANESIQQPS